MPQADFDRLLAEVLDETLADYGWPRLWQHGQIYATLASAFRQAVLAKWALSQPPEEDPHG